jgi:hypothetical protein
MKMHLVLAATFAGLSSHAALASSEGGDTWSVLEPTPYVHPAQALTVPTPGSVSSQRREDKGAALGRSEGGDTWSAVAPESTGASPTESLTVATTAPLSSLQRENPSVYGTPAQADSADRIVRMESDPHSMNVAYGETVEFIAQGEDGAQRSFTWRFDVSPAMSYVDLSEVAPADFPDRKLRVFVAEDPRYSAD